MHQGCRSLFPLLSFISALALAVPACGGGGKADGGKADSNKADADAGKPESGGETGAPATDTAGETGAPAAAGTEGAAGETGAATGETGAGAETDGAGETGADTDGAGETGTADTDGAGETGTADTDGADTDGEVDPAEANKAKIDELLKEASTTKTKDDRALEALEEAKALEAEPKDLAKAANKRGERLMNKDSERATKFFEWAAEADKKYPNAHFNLAKIAALAGEFETTMEHLREVKKRKGRKLLKTVTYDPTFALVADDPEVLKMSK